MKRDQTALETISDLVLLAWGGMQSWQPTVQLRRWSYVSNSCVKHTRPYTAEWNRSAELVHILSLLSLLRPQDFLSSPLRSPAFSPSSMLSMISSHLSILFADLIGLCPIEICSCVSTVCSQKLSWVSIRSFDLSGLSSAHWWIMGSSLIKMSH